MKSFVFGHKLHIYIPPDVFPISSVTLWLSLWHSSGEINLPSSQTMLIRIVLFARGGI